MTDGTYLVRTCSETGDYALSLVANKKISHYQIQRLSDGKVALLDSANGNKEFASIEGLIAFYKSFNPTTKGGLAAYLKNCAPAPQ